MNISEHVKSLIKDKRVGNAKEYESAINQFKNYVDNDQLLFSEVTHLLLLDFKSFKAQTTKTSTVRNYLTHLRAVYNKAIDTKSYFVKHSLESTANYTADFAPISS